MTGFDPDAHDTPTPRRPRNRALTIRDVARYPEYYIAGPGRDEASRTDCGHGYYLTDSCPLCPSY